MRLTVTGLGYLGLVHAAVLASKGHHVLGMDSDRSRIASLKAGTVPFAEPGLTEMVIRQLDLGNLELSDEAEDAAEFAGVHFLCTGTPLGNDGKADLSSLFSAATEIARFSQGPCLLAGKSTVPPGTARALLDAVKSVAREHIEVAWNPEFLREGTAVHDALHPDRIVLGVTSARAREILERVYSPFPGIVFPVSLETAELSKLAANAFLAAKISFINAIARDADACDADIHDIARILGSDARIGHWGLQPGLGFSGGCLPKDLSMLIDDCGKRGAWQARRLLHDVMTVNLEARGRVFGKACELLVPDMKYPSLEGKRITVLGASFKPGTDDTRESPGLWLAEACQAHDAIVTLHDPLVTSAKLPAEGKYPYLWASDALTAVRDADLVILATAHPEYRELEPPPGHGTVIDGQYFLSSTEWLDAGWGYITP